MKRYIVYYHDNSGDLSHVWTEASSKEEAIQNVKSEYWDCKEIVDVYVG